MPLRAAWADLVAHSLEPNVFLEPAFAIPLFQHCQNRQKLGFLLAWAQVGADERHHLLGLLPLAVPFDAIYPFVQASWHEHTALGVPLFDRDRGAEALAHMAAWLRQHHPRMRGLILPLVPKSGPTFALLRHVAEANHHDLTLLDEHERAILLKTVKPETFWKTYISKKRRREYRRQKRRLTDIGKLTYRAIRDPAEIREAAEAFLLLEFRGWKGLRKTALLADTTHTIFLRAMTRLMSLEGKCRIDSLDLDGVPIAMGIVLESNGRAYFWKTAYNERFAQLSPGVQLTLELTQTQLAPSFIAMTDSCAIPSHRMINHIWRERQSMTDVLLPIGPPHRLSFALGVGWEVLRRRLRSTAKAVLKPLLGRR